MDSIDQRMKPSRQIPTRMTKKAAHPGSHSKPKRIAPPSVELESVFLKLESTVMPTWSNPDPSEYVVTLAGNVCIPSEDVNEYTVVGTISPYSVHLGHALEDGMSWFEVLESYSADTALYLDLLDKTDASSYSDSVQATLDPYSSDLLILDRIRIEPQYRGKGYGLYAAELMIQTFSLPGGLAACVPAPYELLQKYDLPTVRDAIQLSREQDLPEWGPAEAKLRDLWKLLGFQQVPESAVFALSLSLQRPTMQEIMQKHFERKSLPTLRIQ